MNEQRDFEQILRAHFEARAERAVADGQLATIFDRTAGRRQRPAWLASLRSPSMSATSIAARPAIPRAAWLLAVVGILVGLALLAAFVGKEKLPEPPLNGRIVFGRFDKALDDTVVYTVNPDGTKIRQVRPEIHEGPFWSPDGTRLGLGHSVANADGSNYQVWDQSANPFHVECWDWSPDGLRMLCEGFNDDVSDVTVHGVYTVRASDGGDIRRLDKPGDMGVPGAYSPDGRMVAYIGVYEGAANALIVVNVDGTDRRRLGLAQYGSPTWAPDSRSVLAAAGGRLFLIDIATAESTFVRMKAHPDADLWAGQYSPDGTRILVRRHMIGENVDLFTMLADGADLVQVTNNPDDDRFMDWGTHPLE